ncbi:MAG: ABC transporter ATP-binding protein [Bacteroidetes bacterium]|nr:MAG: ABC transporter ATP-binding protein [Bacteroidota bacterium]REK07065.1 MAG: ABC transporter ATP-binding protein [Bacteroidota bacterium]REK33589.1 MAG: ABC transporter ATP-binding protein [Bacteroidota bacterium]REK48573.1 MAG: ABC transporter ATP-binding protein [Bacteroidota bacterium]
MNYLSVDTLGKSFTDKILFEGLSFGLAKVDKVALIARNGSGKSTLMKILAGKEKADSGLVTYRKDLKVAYLDQNPEFDEHATILESILHDADPVVQLIREYEACLEEDEKEHNSETQKKLEELGMRMDNAGAWDYERRVRQVLSSLNISQLDRKINRLSGGQRKRIALARVLLEEAELLLMDEPTNHLDVEMVEWLEDYLSRSNISLLLITHDRYFLDNICNRILELDEGNIYSYEGNYSYFLEKKAEREENKERETDKARNILRTELEWMRRMPKARGTKSKSRIDAFYELKDKAGYKRKDEKIQLDVKMNRIGGKVIEMKKVYKSYGDLVILKGFDYTFKTGERVGIVGKNGIGKSTFLNLITGKEEADSGKINVGDTIVFGHYSQEGLELKQDKRVIELVREIADVIQLSDGSKVSASQFLNLFLFTPEMQHTFVSKLSGGEKRRLHMLTVLIRNPNFLILDEPTNDLDLLTLGVLEEFLLHYRGCLLIVSHDRYFMDKLCDHLFIFEGAGEIRDFNGTYSEFRIKQDDEKKAVEQKMSSQKKNEAQQTQVNTPKKKLSYKEKMEFEKLEKEIAALEEEKAGITTQLSNPGQDHQKLQELAERMNTILNELDEKSMRWLELSEYAS